MPVPPLTVVVPTFARAGSLSRAVRSAVHQTLPGVEVIVVNDDPAAGPLAPPDLPGVRVIDQPANLGAAAARNAGVRAARGRWVGFCDDDDELLPSFAEASLHAARTSALPGPVAVLSGLRNVRADGAQASVHLPPSLPRGAHFWMEELPPGRSFLSKQTLVVERDVLLGVGGFDPGFRSRQWTELLPRLNEVCSIQGIDAITMRRTLHEGARISADAARRQPDLERLVARHAARLAVHPRGHARLLYEHAYTCWTMGLRRDALDALARALRLSPALTTRLAAAHLARMARARAPAAR